jgi:hypothetical protein
MMLPSSARAEMTTLLKVDTKCTAPSLIPTVNGNTVRSFSTHGQHPAAKGSSTTVARSDIRLIQYLDSSARGLVRRWLLIGYFPIHLFPHVSPSVSQPGGSACRTSEVEATERMSYEQLKSFASDSASSMDGLPSGSSTNSSRWHVAVSSSAWSSTTPHGGTLLACTPSRRELRNRLSGPYTGRSFCWGDW